MIAQAFDFHLPSYLNASHPPEKRGVRRDHVKMMVINRETNDIIHDCFYAIDQYVKPGDMLVLNNSRTIPAVLKATLNRTNTECEVRLAAMRRDDQWDVLIVTPENVQVGDVLSFSNQLYGEVIKEQEQTPIKTIRFSQKGTSLFASIYQLGEPIRYEYIDEKWGLDYYQTVFANHPGSVEMPSAGRALSYELIFKLQKKGVKIAYLQLHTGLSYLLDDKWDHSPKNHPEQYKIARQTIQDIEKTKEAKGRVIAVGTTVVRALESYAQTKINAGWTNLHITGDFQLQIVDGILTGLHEPKASHLELLSAFLDPSSLFHAYEEAIRKEYLWHEFGDMNLIL